MAILVILGVLALEFAIRTALRRSRPQPYCAAPGASLPTLAA